MFRVLRLIPLVLRAISTPMFKETWSMFSSRLCLWALNVSGIQHETWASLCFRSFDFFSFIRGNKYEETNLQIEITLYMTNLKILDFNNDKRSQCWILIFEIHLSSYSQSHYNNLPSLNSISWAHVLVATEMVRIRNNTTSMLRRSITRGTIRV